MTSKNDYTVDGKDGDKYPSRSAANQAIITQDATLIALAIEAMLESGELIIIDGVIHRSKENRRVSA